MTADLIERNAERAMDALDRAYLSGRITTQDYADMIRELDRITEEAHRLLPRE